MNAEALNARLAELVESHKRYTELAIQVYERSIDAQLAAMTRAAEQAERELLEQLQSAETR